jgi:ElaA protein
MIRWKWLDFSELTVNQLYDIMSLREDVFTFEQQCKERDLDGLDKKAIHLIGMQNNKIIACVRILPPGIYKKDVVTGGRMAVAEEFRGQGIGKQIMRRILTHIKKHYPNIPIEFSAQLYLKKFYEGFGFNAYGGVYDEGGIAHIAMRK